MPGPTNKKKPKPRADVDTNKNTVQDSSTSPLNSPKASPAQCLTLEEDEFTRCGLVATEGYPKPDRCKAHHKQYRTLYKKYKEASVVVDNVKGGTELPTKEQINRYKDWHAALEKARWVRKYLEAIRVEKTGREIHQKRFFLKVDDGHKRRLKLLEREMVRAVEILDALEKIAYQLYESDSAPLRSVSRPAWSAAEADLEKESKRTIEEILEAVRERDALRHPVSGVSNETFSASTALGTGDEDLIQLSLRNQKERLMQALRPFFDLESYIAFHVAVGSDRPPETEHDMSVVKMHFFIFQQFARRIIFHQQNLFMKSLEKVSFKDLVLSDEFSIVDLLNFYRLFMDPLALPLRWFKDAVLDALAMSRHGTAANTGNVENRFLLLGGWVYNRAHTMSMPNEAWWYLLKLLNPPGNIENRFVRLCNNFDDLIGFLSFGAFGLVPCPNFCATPDSDDGGFEEPRLSRNHLSLSGIVVADMVGISVPPQLRGPIQSTRRATKRNCVVWAEIESRAYMFGAVRNEQDPFVDAFLRELRARPDLFQVVLRSETAPGQRVETFGSGASNDEALPAMRVRQFEAPPSPFPPTAPPSARNSWMVARSAVDVLYGTGKEIQGYLTTLARNVSGWFFYFKTFPVRYFVILDTVPNRDVSTLARNVSWAALRAGGYAKGEYTLRKYAVASDKLFDKRMQERLGWAPKEMGLKMTRMEDQINACGL